MAPQVNTVLSPAFVGGWVEGVPGAEFTVSDLAALRGLGIDVVEVLKIGRVLQR